MNNAQQVNTADPKPLRAFRSADLSVNTSQGVARAADTEEQVISPGRPVL
jgi:hypothetical protein